MLMIALLPSLCVLARFLCSVQKHLPNRCVFIDFHIYIYILHICVLFIFSYKTTFPPLSNKFVWSISALLSVCFSVNPPPFFLPQHLAKPRGHYLRQRRGSQVRAACCGSCGGDDEASWDPVAGENGDFAMPKMKEPWVFIIEIWTSIPLNFWENKKYHQNDDMI